MTRPAVSSATAATIWLVLFAAAYAVLGLGFLVVKFGGAL